MPDLVEGRTGTLPDGTRVVVRNGQVVPVGTGPSGSGAPAGSTRLPNGTLLSAPGPRGGAPKELVKLTTQEQIQLARARTVGAQQRLDLDDSERFDRLSNRQDTGGLYGVPLIGEALASAQAPFDPEIDEMREISARLTPAQHTTTGPMTDADARLYGRAVPGVSRTEESNEAIINRGRSRAGQSQLYAEFLDSYASRNGTLQGATQAWNNIYNPPPVREGTPQPRPVTRPTAAQRRAVAAYSARDPNAILGTRANPRVPPEGFDVSSFPAGDWYWNSAGQLLRGGPLQARSQQTRTGVRSVRRVD